MLCRVSGKFLVENRPRPAHFQMPEFSTDVLANEATLFPSIRSGLSGMQAPVSHPMVPGGIEMRNRQKREKG